MDSPVSSLIKTVFHNNVRYGASHKSEVNEQIFYRVLATQASAPLVYVPIEAIASKWYGEHVKPMTITDPGASHQS